ncbi:MAG: T9SS type A sorting domain-containing protein, partial [Syntrophothermus sp.]
EGPVKIILYDINGKELTQLINEIKSPGVYKVKLNADNFASEIYFYSLQTENLMITKKMLLIK